MGVIKNIKKFNQRDLEENDGKAKELAVRILEVEGFELKIPLEDQKEAYKKWDFVMLYKNRLIPIEVERKKVWSGLPFPYSTIDIPYRKKDSWSKVFVMVDLKCETAAITRTSNILSSELITKNTTYTSNEKFFSVPLDKWRFYEMSQK